MTRIYQLVEQHDNRRETYIHTPRAITKFLADIPDLYQNFSCAYEYLLTTPLDEITKEWLENLPLGDTYLTEDPDDEAFLYIAVYDISMD